MGAALPGNPYDDSESPIVDAYVFSADGEKLQAVEVLLYDLVQAQRAANYEARTANLLQLLQVSIAISGSGMALGPTAYARMQEVHERLGQSPTKGTA